ncbi:MAG: GNAT family N-acetyltransferase [Lachnospiraceae bacterium]|nr:GNAT family N-acetyltransferase [Lachnospiraceae bacterium]
MRYLGTVALTTDRLVLRRYRKDDAQQIYQNYGSDPKVNRYITWKPCQTLEGTKDFIEMHLQQYRSNQAFYGWAITFNDEVIGSIGTYHFDEENESCELGYNIGSNYWNQGIATEAVNKVLDFLFQRVGLHKVYASFHEKNTASGRVLEKVGMIYEGTAKEAIKESDGSYADLIYHCIFQSDWANHS